MLFFVCGCSATHRRRSVLPPVPASGVGLDPPSCTARKRRSADRHGWVSAVNNAGTVGAWIRFFGMDHPSVVVFRLNADLPAEARHAADVRLYWAQGPRNDQNPSGGGHFTTPKVEPPDLHHRAAEHHRPEPSRALSSSDESAVLARELSQTGFLGEVRHAVHNGSGPTRPGETQDRR